MRIIVHHPLAAKLQALLSAMLPHAEVVTSDEMPASRADYLAVFNPPKALLEAQDASLKGIINVAAGVDALLNNPSLPPNVPITKLRNAGMAPLMLDYSLYALLHFSRDFDRYAEQARERRWKLRFPQPRSQWPVGVLGLGAIGAQVAEGLARHGYQVNGYSRSAKTLEGVTTFHGEEGLQEVLQRSRAIINILPATPATSGILNRTTLSQMPEGGVVINPGRGNAIMLDDLVELLDSGHLRGAALDVFPHEPLPPESPLWQHPQILITPHSAAPTMMEDAAAQIADYIERWENGEAIPSVDRDAGY